MANLIILSILVNFKSSLITSNTLILLFGIANIIKAKYRNFPVLPEDVKVIFEAFKMISILPFWMIILMVLFFILVIKAVLNYLSNNKYNLRIRLSYLPLLFVSLLSLFYIGNYIKNPKFMHADNVNFFRTQFYSWNQRDNYYVNGPVIGFLYNLGLPEVEKPENYSEKAIKKIVDQYKEQAAKNNQERSILNGDIDFVFIMSESFANPKQFESEYPLTKDPIPFTQKLMSKTSSGKMFGSEYGGGTANVEFEVLTSFTGVFNPGLSYYNAFASKDKTFPSVVKYFNDNQYKTVAIHAYDGNMYKRNIVYDNFGFSKFVNSGKMKYQDRLERSEYISDEAIFNEVKDTLDTDEKSKFVFAVTMQNHASWDGKYDLKTNFLQSTNSDNKNSESENYLQGLNYSDQALEKFIDYINNRKRKTMLVFWGDHNVNIFNKFMEKNSKLAYQTPLFFYSNFNIDKEDLGEMSANYIVPTLFNKMNLKLSPYNTMLLELKNKYPSINVSTLPEIKDEIIKDYQLIRYDILAGKKYSLKEKFFDVKQ